MRKFLAILVFAPLSASGMIGLRDNIHSVPTVLHKSGSRNNDQDKRQVASSQNEEKNMGKFFLPDSYTSTSETISSSHNKLNVSRTFGSERERDNTPFSDTDSVRQDNGSDYEEYCGDAKAELKNKKEVFSIDDTVIEGGKKSIENNLRNRASIQWYYNKKYGAGGKLTVQQYSVPGHNKTKAKLNDKEIQEALEYFSLLNKNKWDKHVVHLSDCSDIFEMSGISRKDYSDQYPGKEKPNDKKVQETLVKSLSKSDDSSISEISGLLIDQYFGEDTSSNQNNFQNK